VTAPFDIRPLTTIEEFREIERLEEAIWGPVDLVPVAILAVTVSRGAVLLGARAENGRLAGFVYSFPVLGRTDNGIPAPYHWSHLLAVDPASRGQGLGVALKLAQRERVLALGLDRIEWTFDPLQAGNAHLNFVRLGVVVEEYEENVYGESPSPLHGGLPTDRFICRWLLTHPHVERRLRPRGLSLITDEVRTAPAVNRIDDSANRLECGDYDLGIREPRVAVEIPLVFGDMLTEAPELALRWRMATRDIFRAYLGAGYRVVDFAASAGDRRGRYLLTTIRADA
jgi:predicted GNAT superfamily acetyltransferase